MSARNISASKYRHLSLVAALTLGGVTAAWAQAGATPLFGEPVFKVSPKCGVKFIPVLSPRNEVLSIIRVSDGGSEKELLAAGAGYKRRDVAQCSFVLNFNPRLSRSALLSLDLRGPDFKEPDSAVNVKLEFGKQTHVIDYAKGYWVDDMGTALKRFIIPLNAGTSSLKLRVSGSAVSADGQALAVFGIDTLDFCFVDERQPEACGASGKPNPAANGARNP